MSNPVLPYASYTYDSPNFLVRYPHRKRNKLVSDEIRRISPMSWFDYGAGDGALLGVLHNHAALPSSVVCYEPVPDMYTELAGKVAELGDATVQVKIISKLCKDDATFDLVTALEVLEHLPLQERLKFYYFLAKNLSEIGVCLIEVPVEFGPILLLKEWGRKVLKKRVSEYSFFELMNAVIFGRINDTRGRHDLSNDLTFISPHRGFDLKRLLIELNSIGRIQEVVKSPFPILPKCLNQCILFSFKLRERDVSKIKSAVIKIHHLNE